MHLNDKAILVTGADGFIGSHFIEVLAKKKCNIKALSLYNSFNNWGWLEDLGVYGNVDVITGDIRDYTFCEQITKNIDIVFHLASLIAIPYSYLSPASYLDTNVKGTLNICQAALKNKCSKVVHVSTSEVYGTANYIPIDEKHPLQPQSPYSASKIGADAIALSFYYSFGLPVSIARPFNTYGPRQSARAIIPTIITQIASGKKKISIGDLRPTRDFNFVADICMGMAAIAESDKTIGETINIGSGSETSISELFNKIKTLMNSSATVVSERQRKRPEKSEVFRLVCDNTKINKLTGYLPKYTFDEGLALTIAWFKNKDNLKRYKTDIYNV